MRITFLEKLYTKCGGEAIPRLFSKKPKLSVSLDQSPKIFKIQIVFTLFLSLSQFNLFFLIKSFFYIIKIFRQKFKYLENEKNF